MLTEACMVIGDFVPSGAVICTASPFTSKAEMERAASPAGTLAGTTTVRDHTPSIVEQINRQTSDGRRDGVDEVVRVADARGDEDGIAGLCGSRFDNDLLKAEDRRGGFCRFSTGHDAVHFKLWGFGARARAQANSEILKVAQKRQYFVDVSGDADGDRQLSGGDAGACGDDGDSQNDPASQAAHSRILPEVRSLSRSVKPLTD